MTKLSRVMRALENLFLLLTLPVWGGTAVLVYALKGTARGTIKTDLLGLTSMRERM